jgi:sterol desaturase/sphingolipid hydroxylase (fatty acid hydroxylase superfamily)
MLALVAGTAVTWLAMALLLVPLESFAAGRFTLPSRRSLGAGGVLLLVNTVVMDVLGGPVLARVPSWPVRGAVAVVAVVLLSDLLGYFAHRAMHHVPWLWRFHAVHHATPSTALRWSDAWRVHPLDFLLHGLAVGLPGALLHLSLSQFASVVVARKLFTALLHADVRSTFGPLGVVLASPAFHREHHLETAPDGAVNFGGTLSLWDRLLGSVRPQRTVPVRVELAR